MRCHSADRRADSQRRYASRRVLAAARNLPTATAARTPRLAYVLCCIAAMAVMAPPALADEPAVRKGHPRIYVTPDTVAALKQRVAGPGAADLKKMRGAAWIMKQKPGTDYSYIHNLPYPAFHWLVTGEKKYLDQTKAFLAAFAADPPKDQYKTPEALRACAMAYDWVHADLTPAERRRFGRGILAMGDYCAKLWAHPPFSNHFVNESLAVLWAGVALADDGVDDKAAERLLALGRKHLSASHAAANEMAGDDGGQFEGFSYNDWGYARPLAYTYEMWRTATGEDLFKSSTFFRTQALWHAHCQRPDTGDFVRADDCPSGFGPGENLRNFMLLLAARYDDPLAQWLALQAERRFVQHCWMDMLWRDYDLEPKSPAELKLPTSRLFGKLGWVAMRSAWDDKNATFALFQCQDYYAGHQHLDANSFVIHKAGSLAIDSGTNDYGPHRRDYYSRSVAHNTMLIFDPEETFTGGAWGPGKGQAVNDGGQLRRGALRRPGEFAKGGPNDVGDIIAYSAGEHHVYVAGDATHAYSDKKCKDFTRQFLFLPPGMFVVYDRVESVKAEQAKTWVLHTVNQPVVNNGPGFSARHRRGTLTGRVLLPLRADLKVVGGRGAESQVAGVNHPPTEKKPDPEAGGWRVELTGPVGHSEKREDFLVVLTALGPGELAMPQIKGGGGNTLVRITTAAQGRHYTIEFPRVGGLGGTLVVRDADRKNVLANVKLIPGVREPE